MEQGSVEADVAAVKRVCVAVPIFNDWEAFRVLLTHLDSVAGRLRLQASVVGINDGSTLELPAAYIDPEQLPHIQSLEILDLHCNMGHQRALAVGLAELAKRDCYDAILVMDGDGEDNPSDIPQLIRAFEASGGRLVLAQRISRSEGLAFTIFYKIYKLAFQLLTGYAISFGNFCVMTPGVLRRLTYMPNMWNSLPATALRSRISYILMPTHRAHRFSGHSHMNFISLALHGLQAISVFAETVIVRLSAIVVVLSVVAAIAVILIHFLTNWFVYGWASTMLGFLLLLDMQALFGLLTASLLSLQARGTMQSVPAIHGTIFVRGWRKLLPVAE